LLKKYKVLPFTADRGINPPVSMSLSNIKARIKPCPLKDVKGQEGERGFYYF